ncbi:MAG: stage II sporulation protein M, partial [Gemmatimonadales bacterium]
MPATTDYRQHLEVETPESVILDYEIAGIGSRALAAIIDTVILMVGSLVLAVTFSLFAKVSSGWAEAGLILSYFALLWGYFAFFEGLRRGQTPGKRRVGIRVVSDTGHAVSLGAAATRNLLRAADFLPPPYLLGGLLVALHPRAKRLGDLVAGTVVVRDRPIDRGRPSDPVRGPPSDESVPPQLDEQEFQLLRQFCERAPGLEPTIRARLADRLLARLGPRLSDGQARTREFLGQLYRLESARRQGRFAARFRGGSTATRMVARKQVRWREFEALAERASRDGLDTFQAGELPDFATRYREVAADLARARTYRAEPGAQQRLERLVAAGHNALYRDERQTARRVWEVLVRECPAAILQARGYVLLAMLSFWIPAAGGFLLLRERPALAQELLPDVMLERADAGAERARTGHGYVEIEAQVRPAVAAGIIGNNLTVTFNCFASGIFLGVGSLVMLAYNGLSLG